MAVFLKQAYNSLGFYSDRTMITIENELSVTQMKTTHNSYDNRIDSKTSFIKKCLNYGALAGYIPVIGTIVGIARIIFGSMALEDSKNSYLDGEGRLNKLKQFGNAQICRGAIETLSLGCVFIIPDLFATTVRFCSSSPQPQREAKIV